MMGTEKRQILVVDDVELNRAVLAELFQDSYEVLEAENGCQALELLEEVGITDAEKRMKNYPHQLSGGMRQRVVIAIALSCDPDLLICDEPTGNLDPQTSRGIMDLLERINRTGTTVLVATHDREMVDNMRRRVIALDRGHLTRDQDRGVYGFDV